MLDRLCEEQPALALRRAALSVAVNQTLASEAHVLEPLDELAIIPPVGGG